jgi:hypothetical protein
VGEFIISIIVRVHGQVRIKHSQNKITADHLALWPGGPVCTSVSPRLVKGSTTLKVNAANTA